VLIGILDQIVPEKQFQHYCSVNDRQRTWSLGRWSSDIRFFGVGPFYRVSSPFQCICADPAWGEITINS
jgi:hypothetical protein